RGTARAGGDLRGCRGDWAAFARPGRPEHYQKGLPAAELVAIVVPASPSTARRCMESSPACAPALSPPSRYLADLCFGSLPAVAVDEHGRPSLVVRAVGGCVNSARRRRVAV